MLAASPGLAKGCDGEGRSALVLAYLHGHSAVADELRASGLELDLVESLMAEDWERFGRLAKADPSALDRLHPVGGNVLYAAALVGSHAFWRLRGAGASRDLAPVGGSGFTPIRGALDCISADWARVSICDLGGNGSDINAPQAGGSSALHACVERRDAQLLRLAIRKGAHVEALDARGRSALALAQELGWEPGQRLLQEHASLPRDHRASRFLVDANRQPIERPSLSDVAQELQSEVTSNSHARLERVRELVSKDDRLVFSISSDDELAIEASAHLGNHAIMRYHLDHGAPYSLPTAVSLGDLAMVRFLLDHDADLINERGAHDFPVMWYVVLGGAHLALAEEFVLRGVSLDQESMGSTALHWCVRRGAHELAEFLLRSGCDPEPRGFKWSRAGETPLQLAEHAGDAAMIALLKREGAMR